MIIYELSWYYAIYIYSYVQYICTEFGNMCNYVLEYLSEYTIEVPKSSTKGSKLNEYKLFFCIQHMYFAELFLIYMYR